MNFYYDTFRTDVGDFSAAVDEGGAVIATAFGGLDRLSGRCKKRTWIRDVERTQKVRREVLEYFSGKRQEFTVRLAAEGTEFQQRVWATLLRIPFGTTRSYGDIAAELGNPNASRAVGGANGANPICLIVPCHRVIGKDGSLTGFAFGEEIKERLLELEQAAPSQSLSKKSDSRRIAELTFPG